VTVKEFGYLIFISIDFSVFVQVSIERIYHALISTLEVRQKSSGIRRISNSFRGVWKCGETRCFVFHIT